MAVVVVNRDRERELIPDPGAVMLPMVDGWMAVEAIDGDGQRVLVGWAVQETGPGRVRLGGGSLTQEIPAHEDVGPLPEPYAAAVERRGRS